MKKLLHLIPALILGLNISGHAQWTSQATGFSTPNYGLWDISIANANTVWGIAYDPTAFDDSIPEFTKTVNGGNLFTTGTLPSGYVWCNISAIDEDTAWLAALDANANWTGRLLQTTDGGVTWNLKDGGGLFPNVEVDFVYFWNGNEGTAVGDPDNGEFSIFTTADGGNTWSSVDGASIPDPINSDEYGIWKNYCTLGNDIWFITTKARIYHSSDKGVTWSVMNTGITQIGSIDFSFSSVDIGIARIYNLANNTNVEVKRTTDGGATWNSINVCGPFYGGRFAGIANVPGAPSTFVSTSDGEFSGSSYSNDGGQTWIQMDSQKHYATKFLNNITGWSASYNTSDVADGIFKYAGLGLGMPTVVNIGTSTNVFTTESTLTYLFADPTINSISMIYRGDVNIGDPSSGYIYYSLSTDGGATFSNHLGPVYSATGGNTGPYFNARYPQGVIYNPPGNTDPSNAYLTYLCPSLAGTVDVWGGYETGTSLLGSSTSTQTEFISEHAGLPFDFCLLQGGTTTIGIGRSNSNVDPFPYDQNILLYKGTWNGSDFIYEEQYVPAPVALSGYNTPTPVGATKIAFGPDGLTGYMCLVGHLDYNIVADNNVSPIVFKTTDGGNTWTSLGTIILDNCDDALANGMTTYISDYNYDMAVDANGECHIITGIFRSYDNFLINISPNTWGVFDLYSSPTGWKAQLISKPMTWEYTFSDSLNTAQQIPRYQVARTLAGDKLFFVYFDTDVDVWGADSGNVHPDVWCAAFDVNTCNWVPAYNMTSNTELSGKCLFGSISPYVFGTSGIYTLPVSIDELTGGGPSSQCTHYYVQGLEINDSQFTESCSPIDLSIALGINEQTGTASSFSVSQNTPNPFNRTSTFNITLNSTADVTVEISNVVGQVMSVEKRNHMISGTHTLELNASDFTAGIYFYSVSLGNEKITHKMIVR